MIINQMLFNQIKVSRYKVCHRQQQQHRKVPIHLDQQSHGHCKHKIIYLCRISGNCAYHFPVDAITHRGCGIAQFHFYPAMDGMLESGHGGAK